MNEQNNVRIDIVGSAAGLRPATAEADAELGRLKASAESSGGAMSSLRVASEGAAVAVGSVASVAAVAGAAWLGYQGRQIAAAIAIKDTADELGKLSQRLGVSVESLSGLRYAADLSDVSLSELQGGLKNLANRAQDNAPAFAAMGVSVRDASGHMKPLDQLLSEVADKFAGYEDGAAKTALANDVFGRSGERLIPLLNQGAAGLRDSAEEAQKLGAIYGSELAKNAEAFNDNLTRIKYAAEGVKIELGSEMLPALTRLTEELLQGTKAAGGFFSALVMGATLNPFKSYGENLNSVRADLERMESDLKEYGYLDEKRYERKKAQLEYLKSMQRFEALKSGDGAYSNEGRGVTQGSGKTEAPTPPKKTGAAKADPLDGLLENYRRDALAQEVGLSSSTVKEIENLGEMVARGKIDVKEYDRLLGAVLDKDSALKREQDQFDKGGRMVSEYQRSNELMLERIRRQAELALMGERERAVAEALFKVDEDGARRREQIIKQIDDEAARTEALAKLEDELAKQKERVSDATQRSIDQQRSFDFGWKKAFAAYADSADNAAKTAADAFSGLSGTMEGALKSFVKTGKVDFRSFGDSVINTLIDIQMQALRTSILAPAMKSAGGWLSGLFGGETTASSLGIGEQEIQNSIGIASVFHEGGVAGNGGRSRQIPMGVFAGAGRFHSGGWPGLASDEVPAILQKGERVLSRGESRGGGVEINIVNQASGTQTRQQQRQDAGGKTIVDVLIETVKGSLINDVGSGGTFAGALEKTYGVNRAAGSWR